MSRTLPLGLPGAPPRGLLRATLIGAAVAAAAPAGAAAALLDARSTVAPSDDFQRLERSVSDGGKTAVLVGLRVRADAAVVTDKRESAQLAGRVRAAADDLLEALGGAEGRLIRRYELAPYVSLRLTASDIAKLERTKLAASLHIDRKYKGELAQSTELIESASQVTREFTGSGRVVAVIDSGVQSAHPFLAGRVLDGACFDSGEDPWCPGDAAFAEGPGAAEPYDPNFQTHGTQVAGVAAGARYADVNFDGVAPGASILPVTAIHVSDILGALQWVRQRAQQGVPLAAVNISMGDRDNPQTGTCDSSPLKAEVDALKALGVATVVSSGNRLMNPVGTTYPPACISSAIAVGSTTKTDVVAFDSNSSPVVDLLAPGVDITTSTSPSGFVANSGTSFAAPHVAGAWATYVSRFPGASVDEVLAAFQSTGKPVTDPQTGLVRNRINVSAAMGRWGFVNAAQPSAAGEYWMPSTHNSTGAGNSVLRTGIGVYRVEMPNLGSALNGNVQVKEYGATANRCKASSLGAEALTTALITVTCFTPAGAPADTTFVAQFQVKEDKTAAKRGYLTSIGSTSPTYVVAPWRLSSSTNAANYTVSRSAPGVYTANFTDFVNSSGVPQVTALGGGSSAYCRLASWVNSSVGVVCFDPAGSPVDTAFSVSFNHQSVFTGRRGAYIYANDAANTAAYSPGATYAWNSQNATTTSRKTATGTYEVVLRGVSPTTGVPVVSAVSAGTTAVACRPVSWSGSVTGTTFAVKCTNAAGVAIDSQFTLSYGTSVV